MKTVSGNAPALAWLFAGGLVLSSSQAAAKELPCFVVPKQGAAYEAERTSYTTPQTLNDCAMLNVTKGEVGVLYLDTNGRSQRAVVAPGQKFSPADAASSRAPYAPLKNVFAVLAKGPSSMARAGKSFDQAENAGLPSGDVHVAADGLPVVVAGEAGNRFSYQLEDAETSRVLQKGSGTAGIPLLMPKALFRPGAPYRLKVAFADSTAASEFTTPPADEERELLDALARAERDQDMDAFSRAIARALIFEDRSFGYNRELALRGAKP